MTWLDNAINEYVTFLKSHLKKSDLQNGWFSITTPFLNMFNDCIEIYCRKDDDIITLSDGKETLRNLELFGVNISRSKIKKSILSSILLNYGITLQDGELIAKTSMKGFGQTKHNLICCITEISDMYMLSKPTVASAFIEDIDKFFRENKIIATPNFMSKGATGLEFNFAYQIAGMDEEILIDAFNIINRPNLAKFIFDWNDIRDARQAKARKEVRGLAIINDEKEVDRKYLDALIAKGTDYILFSERLKPENLQKLTAA